MDVQKFPADHPTEISPAGLSPREDEDKTIKTRVQFDMSPRAMELLTELKRKTESGSYAEVIRNALKLYDGVIGETESGSTFLIRNKEGMVSEFKMFL